ncbi:hypothetical protein BKI52_29355 [marine bacterium AO1-C]|nr:hypothetical protein BKI52_29355 [marine bacterium AO1-C]
MSLEEQHPSLFQFFAGYFPEADLDGLTDVEVVADFKKKNPQQVVQETQTALKKIPKEDSVLQEIANEANRYFETTEDAWQWVQMIRVELEK